MQQDSMFNFTFYHKNYLQEKQVCYSEISLKLIGSIKSSKSSKKRFS